MNISSSLFDFLTYMGLIPNSCNQIVPDATLSVCEWCEWIPYSLLRWYYISTHVECVWMDERDKNVKVLWAAE